MDECDRGNEIGWDVISALCLVVLSLPSRFPLDIVAYFETRSREGSREPDLVFEKEIC